MIASSVGNLDSALTVPQAIAQSTETPARIRPIVSREEWGMRAGLGLLALYLAVTIATPLFMLLRKSVEDADGNFVGLANFRQIVSDPVFQETLGNTFVFTFGSQLLGLILGKFGAFLLLRPFPGHKIVRAVIILPLAVPNPTV